MALRSDTIALRKAALALRGGVDDYDALLARIGNARFVLLGEATHGSHEFYRERAQITKRLIKERGFNAVAIEGDWPDAYRVHRYVTGRSELEGDANEALAGFRRFPTWMWRNADVLDFIGWLRSYNENQDAGTPPIGFYGLDLYSLYGSMEAVLAYLDRTDPEAGKRARARYACFDHFGPDAQTYSYRAGLGLSDSCEQQVMDQLLELQRRALTFATRAPHNAADELFYVEQNARLVKNAEEYYRSMFRGAVTTWNLRDQHMLETLTQVVAHLERQIKTPKIVIWAHNSHLGDARATQMGERGEWNVGQLVRERYDTGAVLVGFTTYEGTVTAASDWDEPAERKRVLPALKGSCEALLHNVGHERMMLLFDDLELYKRLAEPRLERAIGVVYRPDTERYSHYFHARLSVQFDALIHIDRTRAVEPLERSARWESGEAPETYPFAV